MVGLTAASTPITWRHATCENLMGSSWSFSRRALISCQGAMHGGDGGSKEARGRATCWFAACVCDRKRVADVDDRMPKEPVGLALRPSHRVRTWRWLFCCCCWV
jgi:hypothetical protein